jgi:glutaredoxin
MQSAKGAVAGTQEAHRVHFYGLSTCVWCRRTRALLEELGVAFDYVYVDLLQGQDRSDAIAAVKRWNKAGSFPTLVIDDARAVVGFRAEEIRKALGL